MCTYISRGTSFHSTPSCAAARSGVARTRPHRADNSSRRDASNWEVALGPSRPRCVAVTSSAITALLLHIFYTLTASSLEYSHTLSATMSSIIQSIQHSLTRAHTEAPTHAPTQTPSHAIPSHAIPTHAIPTQAHQIEIYTQREELGSMVSSQSPLATTPTGSAHGRPHRKRRGRPRGSGHREAYSDMEYMISS